MIDLGEEYVNSQTLNGSDFTVKITNPKYSDELNQVIPIYWQFVENVMQNVIKNDEDYLDKNT